jgi:hypothetical protein
MSYSLHTSCDALKLSAASYLASVDSVNACTLLPCRAMTTASKPSKNCQTSALSARGYVAALRRVCMPYNAADMFNEKEAPETLQLAAAAAAAASTVSALIALGLSHLIKSECCYSNLEQHQLFK